MAKRVKGKIKFYTHVSQIQPSDHLPVTYHSQAMTTLKYLMMRKRMRKPYATVQDLMNFSPYLGKRDVILANLKRLAKYGLVTIKDKTEFAITKVGEKVPSIVTTRHIEKLKRQGKPTELPSDE